MIRNYAFGAVGVLAVCGLFTTTVAALHIRNQNSTIEQRESEIKTLGALNLSQSATIEEQARISMATVGRLNALQASLAESDTQYDTMQATLKQLGTDNAEIRKYLAQPVPADLRKLLKDSGYRP